MNVRRIRPSDEQWLKENYVHKTLQECCVELGVSERTVFRWAASLGLPTRREVNAQKSRVGSVGATVCRKNVLVNKCCLICEKYKKVDACEIASSIDGFNACKLVCWDFELREKFKGD